MSRCYLDTHFIYVHLRAEYGAAPDRIESWRERVLAELDSDGGVISALVLDELAYRLILAWLRDDGHGDPLSTYRAEPQLVMKAVSQRLASTWQSIDSLSLALQPTDQSVVEQAKSLMAQPGLAPRDAFHAAHALEAACPVIASADASFAQVPGLSVLAP